MLLETRLSKSLVHPEVKRIDTRGFRADKKILIESGVLPEMNAGACIIVNIGSTTLECAAYLYAYKKSIYICDRGGTEQYSNHLF